MYKSILYFHWKICIWFINFDRRIIRYLKDLWRYINNFILNFFNSKNKFNFSIFLNLKCSKSNILLMQYVSKSNIHVFE